MSGRKPKPTLKVVAPSEVDADDEVVSGAATGPLGIRRRPNGDLEFRTSEQDGAGRWLFLCSPIRVRALTRDRNGQNWGRLLEIEDADARTHVWPMPAAMLASERGGDDYRRRLLILGARLGHGRRAAEALHRWLSSTSNLDGTPLPRARAVVRPGWCGDGFILPERVIGSSEEVVYQTDSPIRAEIGIRGSLDDWTRKVAGRCAGHSRLIAAVSAAFAAPLLGPLRLEGASIHFRGGSSIGKTTALLVAGSVWGGPRDDGAIGGYIQSWQATANAIEGLAAAHCDLPLILDELGMVQPEHAARAAYQLASGKGRARANDTGALSGRQHEWRVLVISSGEIGLAEKLAESRHGPQTVMAGQAVRFIDIPADAGRGFGIFDAVAGAASSADAGARMSRELGDASSTFFGTAGPAFVEAFIADRLTAPAEACRSINSFVSDAARGSDGQVQRVAHTFGLLAAAGELAISFGIVPWKPGSATWAARDCFNAWVEARGGTGASEVQQTIAILRRALERDAARFQQIGTSDVPRDRLGYVRPSSNQYLFHTDAFTSALGSLAKHPTVRSELIRRGIIQPGGDGRWNRKERIGNSGPQRVVVINADKLNDDADDACPHDGESLGTP